MEHERGLVWGDTSMSCFYSCALANQVTNLDHDYNDYNLCCFCVCSAYTKCSYASSSVLCKNGVDVLLRRRYQREGPSTLAFKSARANRLRYSGML